MHSSRPPYCSSNAISPTMAVGPGAAEVPKALGLGADESPSAVDSRVRSTEPLGDRDDILDHGVPRLSGHGVAVADGPGKPPDSPGAGTPSSLRISRSLTFRLYTSHFLSTWNSRLFEAAVVYFLAAIFPDNLLPISIYALLRNVVAIALTAPVGAWIDRGNRLTVVRTSIVGQRISVAASCGFFWVMLWRPGMGRRATYGLFAATVVLACIEKLSACINLVSVERDWVVVITEGNESARRVMNARLRRIDLFCKLVGPLAISLIAAASIRVAVYSTLGMNIASVLVEYLFIGTVCTRPFTAPEDKKRVLTTLRSSTWCRPCNATKTFPAHRWSA